MCKKALRDHTDLSCPAAVAYTSHTVNVSCTRSCTLKEIRNLFAPQKVDRSWKGDISHLSHVSHVCARMQYISSNDTADIQTTSKCRYPLFTRPPTRQHDIHTNIQTNIQYCSLHWTVWLRNRYQSSPCIQRSSCGKADVSPSAETSHCRLGLEIVEVVYPHCTAACYDEQASQGDESIHTYC